MRLYHFTSLGHLPIILETGGLWRGEVPIGDGTKSLRGTWLTSDPNAAKHGLDGSTADKREVRIIVVFERGDHRAKPWFKSAHKFVDPKYLAALVETGGGKRKASTWYVCFSQIPTNQFRAIEIRGPDGRYTSATSEQIAGAIAHVGLRDIVMNEFQQINGWLAQPVLNY